MKTPYSNLLRKNYLYIPLVVTLILLVSSLALLGHVTDSHANNSDSAVFYLPVIHSNARQAPVPSLVASIPLEGARCPNDIAINHVSGDVYITNEESDNVSVLHDMQFAGNVATGKWPVNVESDPLSDTVYVSNIQSGITALKSGVIAAQIPPYYEPYSITVNPVNNYTYVNDLNHAISIIRGTEKIMDLFVPDFDGQSIRWRLAAGYDKLTGLTYFASWQLGVITVVDGTEVVDQFPFYGEGAKDLVIDPYRRLLVVTNYRAVQDYNSYNNISIVDLDSKQVMQINSGEYSEQVDFDPVTGYVYVTNPEDDTVTILQGTAEVATYKVGKRPHGVAVDPLTGFAYVTNSGERSVTVFKDAVPVNTITLPENEGFQPWQVEVDEANGRIYILNRSSNYKHLDRVPDYLECKDAWVHVLE